MSDDDRETAGPHLNGKRRCDACLYYEQKEGNPGMCKFNPPAVFPAPGGQVISMPTPVLPTEWCGRFKPAPLIRLAGSLPPNMSKLG